MNTAHWLLTFVLPFGCGFGLAWLARPGRWYQHVAAFVAAVGLSLGLSYAGFLIMTGVTTGNWPETITLGGLASGLAWFAIPAMFLFVPATAAGYVGGRFAQAGVMYRTSGQAVLPGRDAPNHNL